MNRFVRDCAHSLVVVFVVIVVVGVCLCDHMTTFEKTRDGASLGSGSMAQAYKKGSDLKKAKA